MPEAIRLRPADAERYTRLRHESMGFVTWGREPEAIEWEGQRYDELHMALRL